MSKWIRADIDFGLPMAALTVPWRKVPQALEESYTIRDDPDELERLVLKMIEHFRPDLKDGCLVGMEANFSMMEWRFVYIHPSLPKRSFGAPACEMPLIPEEPDAVSG
jgi:hypothetical protein